MRCIVEGVIGQNVLVRTHVNIVFTIMKRIQNFFHVFLVTLFLSTLFLMAQYVAAQGVTRTYEVSSGGILKLDIETGGSITVRGWNRDEVDVNIFVSGRDGGDVIVDLNEIRNGISISTEYEGRNGQADVDIEIHVPAIYDIDLETMGGDVRLENVRGNVKGHTMGGEVTLIEPEGLDMELDLEIKLDDRKDWDDYVIVSDFKLTCERTEDSGRRKNMYASGIVGSGKHRIEIKTVSRNIYLKRGR